MEQYRQILRLGMIFAFFVNTVSTMYSSIIKGFFYPGNTVHGEPHYGLAEKFARTAQAFASTIYQSVYIIDNFIKTDIMSLEVCILH